MADYTDTKVSQLVINNLTQEKFEELKAKGELQEDQIYLTPDTLAEQLANKADVDLNNTQAFKKTGGELLGEVLKDGVLARSPSETELMIKAGSDTTNEDGALFVVYGKNGVSAGQFLARACSADGTMYDLRGTPNGSLQWGGKDIVRQQAVSKGAKGYLKLHNGIIIQWGYQSATNAQSTSATATFPTAFSNTNYSCVATVTPNSASSLTIGVGITGKTTTTVSFASQGGWGGHNTTGYYWLAIGY